MDLTSQLLRQVEFGSELRGYKTSEVDDFLETAAVGLDGLREELSALRDRVERAERVSSERSGLDDEESIRRTLILAQRTADLAIKEAQEEAGQLLDGARVDAESIVSDARQTADRITADADEKLRDEVGRLDAERERLRGEIDVLSGLLGAERERLKESLSTMLRFVEKNLLTSPELASFSVAPAVSATGAASVAAPDVDELEAAIAADAAAAAPSPPPHRSDYDDDWQGQEPASRPSLMALPALEEFGDAEPHTEPTATWDFSGQADSPVS
jgi:cell division initiation protein